MRIIFRVVAFIFILGTFISYPAQAVVYEKYLMAFPLRTENAPSAKNAWFGRAFRLALEEVTLSIKTLVFIEDDEIQAIEKEYRLNLAKEPEPGQMETIADDKDVAVLHGTYQIDHDKITVFLKVIPGRNLEARTFKISGSITHVGLLFTNVMKQIAKALELTVKEEDENSFRAMPGTQSFSAYQDYYQASEILRSSPKNATDLEKCISFYTQALKIDPEFVPARARRASCRIQLARLASKNDIKPIASSAKKDLEMALKKSPRHPLAMNAHEEYLMLLGQYESAKKIGEANLSLHPANDANYLLLGKIYKALKMTDAAEQILVKGLDQQGTALQKKPFNLDLGLLLLNKKDDHAEVYLKEVLALEPQNAQLHYLRASALFRLKKYMDAMSVIQKAETIRTWRDLLILKAETALALGNSFYIEGDYDRAYSYASIAVNLRERHFETLLLMAKVLRKKGFRLKAQSQLEEARKLARKKYPKDHLWLGTEFVAQGLKNQGAEEYILYLKLNPKAPERRRLITLIRKLQGDLDE